MECVDLALANPKKMIAIDTETSSFNAWDPTTKLIAISWAWGREKHESAAALYDHKEGTIPVETLRPIFARLLASPNPKCMHNAKFDLPWLETRVGSLNNLYWDTMLGEHYLDSDARGTYSLKQRIVRYDESLLDYEEQLDDQFIEWPEGEWSDEERALIRKFAHSRKTVIWNELCEMSPQAAALKKKPKKPCKPLGFTYEMYEPDALLLYAAVDTYATRKILEASWGKHGNDGHNVMDKLYIPGTKALANLEFNGIKLDLEAAQEAVTKLTEIYEYNTSILESAWGITKINSAREVGEALKRAGVEPIYDYRGEIQVNKETMEVYKKSLDENNTYLLELLVEAREANKARTTYIGNWITMAETDGRIHGSFNLHGTATGRLSASRPNLQNVPKTLGGVNLKSLLVPSRPGMKLFQVDIAAAEIRVLCAYTNDEALITAMTDPTMDIHSFIACGIVGVSYEEFLAGKEGKYKEARNMTKRVLFGIIYGAGAAGIASQVYGANPTNDQIKYAQSIMDGLMRTYPNIKRYIRSTEAEALHFYQVKSMFGRLRSFPLSDSRGRICRQAVNFKIQSTSSDLVLMSLASCSENISDLGPDAKLMLTVHDSIVGECREEDVHKLQAFFDKHIVELVKTRCAWLPVPFRYDLSVGDNYGSL